MKIAVTGGSGQLGTLVLRRLIADRAVKEVVSLDPRPPAVASAKVRAVEADVRDPDLARHLAGCDAVVHLAFLVTAWAPRELFWGVNVEGSRNVFRAAVTAGVRRIVYASSVAAYGVTTGHPVPLVEDSARVHVPTFPYSATKYEVEAFLDAFEAEHPAVAIARLRPGILIGAHMDHALGDALRRGVLVDTGPAPMPVVWDEDVADAVVLALRKEARGAFNVSADDALPVRELARRNGLRVVTVPRAVLLAAGALLPALAGLGLGRATDPAWLQAADAVMVMSSERAKSVLGWTPACPTAADVIARYLRVVPGRTDARIRVFFAAARLGAGRAPVPHDARDLTEQIHLALTGREGGDYGLYFDHGRLSVREGVPRPPTAVVTLAAKTFLDLLARRADFASAQLTGKVRIEGTPVAGMVLQGLLAAFRQGTGAPGVAGQVARGMARWFEREGA